MIPKPRMIVYSVLGMPMVVVILLAMLRDHEGRSGFLSDYSRTLGRVLSGDWELKELTEPQRRRFRDFDPRSGWGQDSDAVFETLDKNQNRRIESEELGLRLASLYEAEHGAAPTALSANEFRDFLFRRSQPAIPSLASVHSTVQAENQASQALSADTLFQRDHVAIVEVDIDPEDWRQLCNQTRDSRSAIENPLDKPYTYFRASVKVDGYRIDDVAIRKKGFIGSQDTIRPSLKIKFDEYVDQDPVEGIDRLTLNNNRQDRALVSQYLTYQLFNDVGISAPRSAFAAVTVNGQYLGVYSHVESVKQPFFERIYGDPKATVFEGTLTDLYPKSMEWFDPKTKYDDRSKLLELATILHEPATTVHDIESMIDMEKFLRYWAVESLINFWDGYTQNQNNYFIYVHHETGKMEFLPWGADSCFATRRPHFSRRGSYGSHAVRASSILANRLYHFDSIPARYKDALLAVLRDHWDEEYLLRECERLQQLLLDYVGREQLPFVVAIHDTRNFISQRRRQIMADLDDHWPADVAPEPKPTMYREVVGEAEGKFRVLEGTEGFETQSLAASLTLDGEPTTFDGLRIHQLPSDITQAKAEFTSFLFDGIQEARPIQMLLTAANPIEIKDGVVKVALTGDLSHSTNSRWQRRQAKGTLELTTDGRSVVGEFRIKIFETRGRRW